MTFSDDFTAAQYDPANYSAPHHDLDLAQVDAVEGYLRGYSRLLQECYADLH